MKITLPLFRGKLRRRYKRFLAEIETEHGEILTIHCPNSGAMTGCAMPGSIVHYSDSLNPSRKLRYTLEVVETPTAMMCVNTQRANALVEEALRKGRIPSLSPFKTLSREVPYGKERSRVDFLLRLDDGDCYVEVKNVTLSLEPNVAAFPDAVSIRGQKHLRELMTMLQQGHRAALIYCVGRTDVDSVRAAEEIDHAYASTLLEARQKGLEVYALKIQINLPYMNLVAPIPIVSWSAV